MIIDCRSKDRTSVEVQQAIIALSNLSRSLRGIDVPFVLELTKTPTGTKLVLETFREELTSTETVEPEVETTEPKIVLTRSRVRKPREVKTEEPAPHVDTETTEPKPEPASTDTTGVLPANG